MLYNVYMEPIDYKTIQESVITEQEIQKSKFITYLAPVQTEAEAKEYLRAIKKEHPKATHHCSAYVVGEIERSNDDGEPSSSAGLPMLQVLRGNKMNYVIAVVVRYYGGILLGVGGLIRAYGSSVTLGIQEAEVLVPQRVFLFRVSFPYEFTNDVEVYAGSVGTVIERQYDTLAVYDVRVLSPDALDKLSDVTRGMGHKELIQESIELIKEVS